MTSQSSKKEFLATCEVCGSLTLHQVIGDRSERDEDGKTFQRAAIYWVREDGRIFYANDAACQALGYSRDELLSMSIPDINPDFPMEVWPEHWEEMKKSGRLTFKAHHRTKAGRVFPVEITTNFLTYESQEFVWDYVRDISERERAEHELQLREQQLRLIYDSTADILFYLKVEPGPNYRFLAVNPAFLKFITLTEEQVVGHTINEIIPEPSLTLVYSNYEIAIREKRVRSWEETTQYPTGLKTGIVTIAPIFNSNENCTHLVGSVHDITDHKLAEESLKRTESELLHSSRLSTLGEMVAGIAHEISQPLFAISNFSEACHIELMDNGTSDKEEILSWVQSIAKASEQAGGIIKNLRLFTSGAVPKVEWFEVNEIIADSTGLLAFQLRNQSVEVTRQIPNCPIRIFADRIQIVQVLVNLIQNASDAMLDLPVDERMIDIQVCSSGDFVEFAVSDYGTGPQSENDSDIFDAFVTTKQEGLGMGLAISKRIVEEHGGRIWWKSNPEGGTSFRFTLPFGGTE